MTVVEFVPARSLDEAVAALTSDESVPIAGGTGVSLLSSLGIFDAVRLVSLSEVAEIRGVISGRETIVIGAGSTHAELAADRALQAAIPALATMFNHIGNIRVRAWGTLGGNLAFAEPSLDPPVFLSALGATVDLVSAGGRRSISIDDLSDGPMSTTLGRGEIIAAVSVRHLAANERCSYKKFLPRTADDYATVSTAVKLALAGDQVVSARIVCGSVGPTPIVCTTAGSLLVGEAVSDSSVLARVSAAVSEEVRPFGDLRGSADYKRQMAGVFAKRALLECAGATTSGRSSA